MRPPPKRTAGRPARGRALVSPPVLLSDDFLQAEAPSPESADPLPSLATISTQADLAGAAPGAIAVVDEGQQQGRPPSNGGCSFRDGDVVLASVPGTPSPSEATVVELDPSGGSRLRVALKDKRKQGGWRNQTDVSGLLRSTDAGGPFAGQRPRSDEHPTAAVAACAARGGDDTAGDATAADTAAGGCFSPPPVTLAFSHLLGTLEARSVPFVLPAELVGFGGDVSTSSCVGGGGAGEGDATSTDAGGRGNGDGVPVARSGEARGRLPVAAPGAPETVEDGDEAGSRAGRAPSVAAIGAREPTGTAPATSSGASYRVGDAVLASTAGRPAREATVVELDPSDGSRFRVAFKDKRKKGGWRDKSELSGLAPPSDAASAAEQPQLAEESSAADSACVAAGAAAVAATAAAPGLQNPTPKVPRAATKSPRMGSQPPVQRREGPVIKAGTTAAPPAPGAAARDAAGESGVVASQPRRKRSAAMAAAAAISSTAGTGNRVGGGRSSSGDGSSQNPAGLKKKGKGVKANRGHAAPPVTAKPPRRKDWQRPKIVTPGSAEGRPEAALRTSHPTELIRPRRQFKVQQQARPPPKARLDASASSSRSGGSGASAGRAGTGGGRAPRRMLCQPIHSVQDTKRGLDGGGGRSSGGGKGEAAEDDDEWGVRRGRRVRKQVHPSLSEDTMAAALGDARSDYEDSDEGSDGDGEGGAYGDAPFRFRKSEVAPWGEGDRPLIKVRLSLLKGDAPLSAERSALSVVTFAFDRHRYSGEQLANVLTSQGFLCYYDEDTRVFVLTDSKDSKDSKEGAADHKEALKRVREVALERCGVRVEVTPWLEGRPALDTFLDNHRRVLDLIIRHRLACGMWSEVGGVYFNALFCGRRSKRTFNGVRLAINLAVEHNRALETGVWELWITVEPAVHRFSPVDWWALLQEKKDKGLSDFSGSKSDDLEERLQVVCLPKLSRGVVYDVKEDEFEMDRLEEANLKRGYLVGPRSEDEMAEYWRQVHHLNLPSSNFVFVKVRIGGMVLTYPSWCVIRGQREVPEATRAMRGRILDSFTDALDGMEGVHVLETTFSWALQDRGRGSGTFGDAPAFATANGTVVGQQRKKHAEAATAAASCPVTPASPVVGPLDHRDHNHDGDAACGDGVARAASGLCTPRPDAPAIGNKTDEGGGPKTAPVVTPFSISASSPSSSPPPPLLVRRLGEQQQQQQQSPESRAAAEAAQTSLAVVRQSFVRRRGAIMAKKALPPPPVAGAEAAEPASSKRLCSTPFLVRRKPPLSPSAAANSDASPRARGAGGAGGSSSGGTSRPLDLSAGDASAATAGRASSGGGAEKIGGGAAGADPDTPRGSGGSKTGEAPPGAARVVTPATAEGQGVGAAAGAGRKKRKERQQPANQEAGGGASSKGKGRKKSKKRPRVSAAAAGAGAGGASEGVVTANARPAEAAPAPAPITVTFSAGGSLGMGLMADVTEEGSMCLAGKSPTSAAAPVPDGWRLIEVDGKSVRRLGEEKIAALLAFRPVEATFEEVPRAAAATAAASVGTPAPAPAPAPRKRAAPAKSKPAAAKPKARGAPKAGGVPKAVTKASKGKGKKTTKVTTARKAFKVQSRIGAGGGGSGGDGGGGDGGSGHASVATAARASSTAAAI